MQKHTKTLLKDNFIYIAIAITIAVVYLSLIKMPKLNVTIKFGHLDKIQHCIAYLCLSLSWLVSTKKRIKKFIVVLLCIVFGMIIEVLQHTLTSYRTGDVLDVVANTIGILIGLLVFNKYSKKKSYN